MYFHLFLYVTRHKCYKLDVLSQIIVLLTLMANYALWWLHRARKAVVKGFICVLHRLLNSWTDLALQCIKNSQVHMNRDWDRDKDNSVMIKVILNKNKACKKMLTTVESIVSVQSESCATSQLGLYNRDVICASLTCWPNNLLFILFQINLITAPQATPSSSQ